jgi:DNA-binding transcriptional ArsR family regulator
MANPVRLAILMLLIQEEAHVGAIASHVGLSQSAVSQHLAKLRGQHLVTTRRDAQTIYYSSGSAAVRAILNTLHEITGSNEPQP